MSTNSRQTISSDGNNVKISTDGVTQNVSKGCYESHSDITNTRFSMNGLRESGNTRNVEVSGNSQESYAGSGLTSEYRLKVVGSPDLFTGEAQRMADAALADLTGLLLQTGDDRNSAPASPLPSFDPQQVVTKMTSSYQNMITPDLPQITRLADIPKFAAAAATWFSGLSVANMAEAAARAGALEIERQIEQAQIALEKKKEEFGNMLDFSSSTPSAPSNEDKQNVSRNITRKEVYETICPKMDTLLAAQRNIC